MGASCFKWGVLCGVSLFLLLSACRHKRASLVHVDAPFIVQARSMTPAQRYAAAMPYVNRMKSDNDRNQATRWLCAAAYQDWAPAYYALAQFYLGVQDDGQGNPLSLESDAGRKGFYNVALGVNFLLLARDNTTHPDVAEHAKLMLRQVVPLVGVSDAIFAQRYRAKWMEHQEVLKEGKRQVLSYYLYDTLPCLWSDTVHPSDH